MRFSLIIPAYNEESRIGATLSQVSTYLANQPYDSEIIVVDDGSVDRTREVVTRDFPGVRVIRYDENRGKGYAVRAGTNAATGAYRAYYDADASTPIDELEKFWLEFERGAAVAIGSRSLPESRVEVHQPWYRENMGRVFNLLLRAFGLTHFPDTQCGFKAFTAKACAVIFPRQTVERFGFDAELLYIAQLHGLPIAQVPVRWINCPHTRVHALADSTRMISDLLTIRLNALKGRYR
ncbi:MAG: glycosyltransferase family 2 protein [Candidatus Hydrogenedentes bacterium]|nr:glycosyltransferase family 2 protein [Candidatus Hydrogenedentota bacterium]